MDPRSQASSHVHSWNRRKRSATGTWILVPGPTATCTGPTGEIGRLQAGGSMSRGLQPRAQVEQAERCGHRLVDPRLGAYRHRHRSNRRKRAATGSSPAAYRHVHRWKQAEKGGHRHVDPPPRASSHVHMSKMRKRAATGTWTHVQGPTTTCTGITGEN